MKVLLILNDEGQYINKEAQRCNLLCCQWAKGPRADEFVEFPTLQDAIKYYGLEEYHEPVPEVFEPVIEEEVVVSNEENTAEEEGEE